MGCDLEDPAADDAVLPPFDSPEVRLEDVGVLVEDGGGCPELKVIVSLLSSPIVMADSLCLDAVIEMRVAPSPSLSTSIASLSALLLELAAAAASSFSGGSGAVVFVSEKVWVPLAVAFGMISLNLSKYGQPLLRNGAMALLDCEASQL